MRNLRVLALLAGLGWCCRAQAAVDCNMPEFEFVNDAYVCLSGTFKAQNNQIQDMEDKLKRPSEKIRNELAQVKKKLARETGDTPKASAARKKLEKWADENGYLRIPVVKYLFVPGVWLWFYLLAGAWRLLRKEYPACLPLMLAAGYFATLLLGPTVQLRYLYPLMAAFPFLLLDVRRNGRIGEQHERI